MADTIDINRFRQGEIPGTERKSSPEVERLADELRQREVEAKDAGVRKNDAAEALVFALQRADVRRYRYIDSEGTRWTICVKDKTTVTIKRGHGED